MVQSIDSINILIAEDEKIIGMDLKLILQKLGYKVLNIVDSGEKLLKILAEEHVDIVLMDIMLKGKINGIQTAKLVLEKFETPVIYLTALTDDEIMEHALLTQPYGYLIKPYESKSLYSTIELAIFNHQREMKAKKKAEKLEEEKLKNDSLLGNIFPQKIVEELKKHGSVIPRYYQLSTILFSELYDASFQNNNGDTEEKNEILNSFDDIIAKHGLERLKTVGNEIMVSGGIPDESPNHVFRVIQASLKMQNLINELNKKFRGSWQLKTGINSGNIMAGFIGSNKLSYDVWGDTVNIASRMKSTCEPNKINISGETYRLTANYFNFEYRGRLDAKGKGKIDMYFVNSEKVQARQFAV